MSPPSRAVTLVLCTGAGELLGVLPPFDAAEPWWQEVSSVVAGAWRSHAVDVTVLRLLDTGGTTFGDAGPVTYLAEAHGPVPARLGAWTGPDPLADEPLRLPYARPGGPQRDLAWADEALAGAGTSRTGLAVQQRTWNLSSIWRLPTTAGDVWLKVVPPFFAHEGTMLARLGADHAGLVPPLLAADGARILMSHVPGHDHYDADVPVLLAMVASLVGLQVEWADRVGDIVGIGAPDWRCEPFTSGAQDVLQRTAVELDPDTVGTLRTLVEGLGRRFADAADCGVPDSLVHGDFHPGNACGPPERPVLLDWGDCGVGNPLLDQAALTARLSGAARDRVLAEWSEHWRAALPGCDPDRAARLLRPVAALRQAMVYRSFLDAIEPDERVYHSADPARWLRRAAQLVQQSLS